jgi:hypothetical protein
MTPMIIQQTAEQAALAFELHTRAEIKSIRLLKSRVASRPLFKPPQGPVVLRIAHKARQAEGPEGVLRLEVNFRVTGVEEQSGPTAQAAKAREPLLAVECTWALDYQLASGYRPGPEAVKAFKDGNAVFHCWPYFREYVQSTVSRMNLPPLTLPLLRLIPKPPSQKVAKQSKGPRGQRGGG